MLLRERGTQDQGKNVGHRTKRMNKGNGDYRAKEICEGHRAKGMNEGTQC